MRRLLHILWLGLVGLGTLHTGPLYYEDEQLLSALAQVGFFPDRPTASRGRTPDPRMDDL
ncbi:hypothetical protein ACIBL8_32465 [Streptomyces sp. NPDC050523]|uniref:hypothetical protein n=1 Tax=Streptomyces sp. NPDC050523 TaxID=3365622 RepID=UPI0037928CF7